MAALGSVIGKGPKREKKRAKRNKMLKKRTKMLKNVMKRASKRQAKPGEITVFSVKTRILSKTGQISIFKVLFSSFTVLAGDVR